MRIGTGSGDDVGDELILKQRNLVAQHQFTLLQPGDLKLVRRARGKQCVDRRIEIAMLAPHRFEPTYNLFLVHHERPRTGTSLHHTRELRNGSSR